MEEQDIDDLFFERLQENLTVTYDKSKVLGAVAATTTSTMLIRGDNVSKSERKSLFQRLRLDFPSEVASLTLTDFNPIFNILGRGTKKDAEVEVTMKEALTKAFAIKLAVIILLQK